MLQKYVTSSIFPKLFEAGSIGQLRVKNRILRDYRKINFTFF